MDPVLEALQERLTADLHGAVECETEILRKRAFSRAIKARHPDADFMAATATLGCLHLVKKIFETVFDPLGDYVLRDFRGQLFVRSIGIRDNFFNRTCERTGGVEEIADGGHGCYLGGLVDVFGAVVGISRIKLEETKARFALALSRI